MRRILPLIFIISSATLSYSTVRMAFLSALFSWSLTRTYSPEAFPSPDCLTALRCFPGSRASHGDACLCEASNSTQPMAEMPQWLINPLLAPESMMVDGAISGPPPETGTGTYGGFRHDLAPRLVP
ncbi:uncharacterized protein F4812DRAFT_252496 [Daldinia caldariorum]|uniref:uncharacterized protein n=1 Tax=Daldinia caldariorum TaxID=326644 RepID=UPI002007B890|nr:uncharacterized protein F4812DRAFT_252496 [Daldinia caldariorum]KAI1463211.1 hypothetical protein F4812DRAFT_252496 [Daldinia caldariorum]